MVNTRNNQCNGQANNSQANNANNGNNNPQMEQLIATHNQLMEVVLQILNHLQPNQPVHQQQPSPPPPPQSRLGEFLRTRPTTFSQAKDPMKAKDWLKSIEKKLEIA
jgi:hypothetical protein